MNFFYENAEFLKAGHSGATRNIMSHKHDFYELNFLIRGKTKMTINEKDYDYESYDIILIPPGMSHILYKSEYATFDNYIIWFEFNDVETVIEKIIKIHDYDGSLQYLFAQIYKIFFDTDEKNTELINLYLKTILCHIKQSVIKSKSNQNKQDETLIEKAILYINENIFERRLYVSDICEKFDVSPGHFTRAFKNKTGASPIKYMTELRIAEAKRLLDDHHISVKEVSSKLFYTDPFYFSKQFSKVTGLSPSQYRKNTI